jgi:ferredoxin
VFKLALRNIVKIDEDKCNGCGLCVKACAEGAIAIIDGKAKLVSEIYCDGLGACIGHCPQGAITVEQRDSAEFDELATKQHLADLEKTSQKKPAPHADMPLGFMCPGLMAKQIRPKTAQPQPPDADAPSELTHWPVQLKLVNPEAAYFKNTDLLLAADCVPFAMGNFHSKLLKGKSLAIGCPKLDDVQLYIEKLAEILKSARPKTLTVVHMEVPCCSALTRIAQQAMTLAAVDIDFEDITIALDGTVLNSYKDRVLSTR